MKIKKYNIQVNEILLNKNTNLKSTERKVKI